MDLPFLLTAPPAPPSRPPYGVRLTKRRTLSVLYRYEPGVPVEYPESGVDDPVGHLIPVDAAAARLPWVDFAYSRVILMAGRPVVTSPTPPFSSTATAFLYPARSDMPLVKASRLARTITLPHSLGAIIGTLLPHGKTSNGGWPPNAPHANASRRPNGDFRQNGRVYRRSTPAWLSPPTSARDVSHGEELAHYENDQTQQYHSRRGYSSAPTCEGRIIYHEYPDPVHKGATPRAYLSCEHYSRRTPDHWADFTIQDGGYDVDYIAAYFLGNTDEVGRIEEAAAFQDQGPLAFCNTLRNYTAQTLHCPVDHRVDGRLAQVELCHLECEVKFRIWYPDNFQQCPFVLVTSKGTHRHPIPLPEKTPQRVRQQILELLGTLRQDLPDMTARRFLRHPALKSFLMKMFPHISLPTLSAIHPSLANRAHLGAYIARARRSIFRTARTGELLPGVQHLKKLQDAKLPAHLHYIRLMLEIDDATLPAHDEDDDDTPPSSDKKTRIIICMAPDSSARLQQAQYLQSDIGFKRIVGFDEFEIASMDRDANTSIVFCRVYLTRHTAAAHQRIFQELNELVHHDTGCRYIGDTFMEDRLMISALDLSSIGALISTVAKPKDLDFILWTERPSSRSTPWTSMSPTDPCTNLARTTTSAVFTVCAGCTTFATYSSVPFLTTSDDSCVRWHAYGTRTGREPLHAFFATAGKPPPLSNRAPDWIRDKESCQFAFPGICWERSFIPLPCGRLATPTPTSWRLFIATSTETASTQPFLGGLLRGQDYDQMQRGYPPSIRATWDSTLVQGRRLHYKCPKKMSFGAYHRRKPAAADDSAGPFRRPTPAWSSPSAKLREALARFNRFERLVAAPHLTQEMHTELQRQLRTASNEAIAAARKYDKQVKVGEALRAAGFLPIRTCDLCSAVDRLCCAILTAAGTLGFSTASCASCLLALFRGPARLPSSAGFTCPEYHITSGARSILHAPTPTAAYIAPTQPPLHRFNTPNPLQPIMFLMFAPANALPTAPATHCAPGTRPHFLTAALATPLFHPEHPGIDINMHSLEAGKYFYVANPAREEGIYTSSTDACLTSQGVVNGIHVADTTFAEAKGLWALACLCWQRARMQDVSVWNASTHRASTGPLQGSTVICRLQVGPPSSASRKTRILDDIHIRSHRDVSVAPRVGWGDN
ncbi:hypothetical protein B0H14DRAFT_3522115 [Mycena olivaceomarginata]|nr:hypothetical protein B0H14DRAFT_3522115 [Mycena olivaceomarginata]